MKNGYGEIQKICVNDICHACYDDKKSLLTISTHMRGNINIRCKGEEYKEMLDKMSRVLGELVLYKTANSIVIHVSDVNLVESTVLSKTCQNSLLISFDNKEEALKMFENIKKSLKEKGLN